MHLRSPAFDHGVISFLWALFFGLFIWIGGSAVGYGSAVTFITGAVVGFLTFLSSGSTAKTSRGVPEGRRRARATACRVSELPICSSSRA